jgi:hypothetical protein
VFLSPTARTPPDSAELDRLAFRLQADIAILENGAVLLDGPIESGRHSASDRRLLGLQHGLPVDEGTDAAEGVDNP